MGLKVDKRYRVVAEKGMGLDRLTDRQLMWLLKRNSQEKPVRGDSSAVARTIDNTAPLGRPKKRSPYDMPNLAGLPDGQRRAVEAVIGGGFARTYPEAAEAADMFSQRGWVSKAPNYMI